MAFRFLDLRTMAVGLLAGPPFTSASPLLALPQGAMFSPHKPDTDYTPGAEKIRGTCISYIVVEISIAHFLRGCLLTRIFCDFCRRTNHPSNSLTTHAGVLFSSNPAPCVPPWTCICSSLAKHLVLGRRPADWKAWPHRLYSDSTQMDTRYRKLDQRGASGVLQEAIRYSDFCKLLLLIINLI